LFPIRDTVPSRHAPVMTGVLIGLNVVVFLYELALGPQQLEQVFYLFGIVPARFSNPEWALQVGFPPGGWWSFLTSMFLHGGFLHLAGNMWFLWIFADNVEDRTGPFRFLAFYLLCGLIAGQVHWLTNVGSKVPTVGASGAIAGVLGAYFVLYPRSRVLTLIPVFFWPLFVELPAVVFLFLWFLLQLFSGTAVLLSAEQVGGVAWWAHIGGFLAGALLHPFFLASRRRRLEPLDLPGEVPTLRRRR
jgi:membrane associated rhomboid family serine protease